MMFSGKEVVLWTPPGKELVLWAPHGKEVVLWKPCEIGEKEDGDRDPEPMYILRAYAIDFTGRYQPCYWSYR